MPTKNPLFDANWKLIPKRSTFTTSVWKPESENRLYKAVRGGYELSVTGIKNGEPFSWGYTAIYDGQDHPVHERKDVDAIEAYKVNNQITIGFFKKKGKEVAAYKRSLSDDGKSLSVIASGVNTDGSIYFDSIEYKVS
jgi:hypothetical protein